METLPPAHADGTRRLCLPVRERGKTEPPPARGPWSHPCRCPQDTAQSQNRTPSTAQGERAHRALEAPPPPLSEATPSGSFQMDPFTRGTQETGRAARPPGGAPLQSDTRARQRRCVLPRLGPPPPVCPGAPPFPSGLPSPSVAMEGPRSFPGRYLLSLQHSALLPELKHGPSMLVPGSPRHVGRTTGLVQHGQRVTWGRGGVAVIRSSHRATPLPPQPPSPTFPARPSKWPVQEDKIGDCQSLLTIGIRELSHLPTVAGHIHVPTTQM